MDVLDTLRAAGVVGLTSIVLIIGEACVLVSGERWLIGSGPRAASAGPGDGRASTRDPRGAAARALRALVVAGMVLVAVLVAGIVFQAAITTSRQTWWTWGIIGLSVLGTPLAHVVVTWRAFGSAAKWWDRTMPVTSTAHDRRARRRLLEQVVPMMHHEVFVGGALIAGLLQAGLSLAPSIVSEVPDTTPVYDLLLVFSCLFLGAVGLVAVAYRLDPLARFAGLVLTGNGKRWERWQVARTRTVDLRGFARSLSRWQRRELRSVPTSLRGDHVAAFHQACEALRLLDDRRHTDPLASGRARSLTRKVLVAVLATDHRASAEVVRTAVPVELRTTPPPLPARSGWGAGLESALARGITVLTFISGIVTVIVVVVAAFEGMSFPQAWKEFGK